MAIVPSELFSFKTLVHAIAGATGSVVAMGTFYPLDTVRSRLQLDENREAKNTLAVLKELVHEEGFLTLYRGMVPVLESLCASNFVYFYTFHGLKAMRGKASQQTAGSDLLVASLAGVVNVLLTTPLWVVNTRLKMQGLPQRKTTAHQHYTGLWGGLVQVAQQEGVQRLWSGALPSLVLVTNPAVQFMVYEWLKRRVGGMRPPSASLSFALGAVAKAVATVLTYPLQLLQTKLRHGHAFKDLPSDAGMVQMTMYILKKFGVIGLYKGMEAKIIQTVLTAALMFAAYEKIAAFVLGLLLGAKTSR